MRNILDLARQLGYLEVNEYAWRIGLEGWKRLGTLRREQVNPSSVFVAMSFGIGAEVYDQGIAPVLEELGFSPIRVDRIEHNGKIDDRIVADIRKSALMIAEFTEQRQNVYFEAGLALRLGRHVIWVCREDEINAGKLHFDTRQYNHVRWTDPQSLRKALRNRIEATIPLPRRDALRRPTVP